MWWGVLLAVLAGYLVGAIPFGWLLVRSTRGADLRALGSGKTGFTNAARVLGLRAATPVLAADVLKTVLLVAAIGWMGGGPALKAGAALAAVVGHAWPVYAGFHGGAGVAAAGGAAGVLDPIITAVAWAPALVLFALYRYASLTSLAGSTGMAVAFLVAAAAGWTDPAFAVFAVGAWAVIVVRHRENVRRLRQGTEPKLGSVA